MNADEIVKALRAQANCEKFYKEHNDCSGCPMPYKENPSYQKMCVGFGEEVLPQTADLIRSLQSQLADYHHTSELVDGKMEENQRLRRINENFQEQLNDVVPVVRGEWTSLTECSNEGVYCSVCHKKVWKADYAICTKTNKIRSNYCPHCGARMDGTHDN